MTNLPSKTGTTAVAKEGDRLRALLYTESVKSRFDEMLGKRSAAFISSIMSAVNTNPELKKCEPMSIISSAAIAASMDLPINPSLGFAHMVPYKGVAQFQMGWKGFIQLAMRTGQYKTINLATVFEGQIKSRNPFTGEMEFNPDVPPSENPSIEGFLLYFKLLNGFEKYFFMSYAACEAHGKRYSAAFKRNWGPWVEDFEAMALKTVAKMGLSKYGILSIDMQKAIEVDQGEVDTDGSVQYPDAVESEAKAVVEAPTEKVKSSRLAEAIAQPEKVVAEVNEPAVLTEDNLPI